MLFCLAWLKYLILGLFSFHSDEPRREGKKTCVSFSVLVFPCSCTGCGVTPILQLSAAQDTSLVQCVTQSGLHYCARTQGYLVLRKKRGHEINSPAFPVVALVVASFLKFPYLTNPVSYNNS